MTSNSCGVPFLSGKRNSTDNYRGNYDKIFRDRPVERKIYIVTKDNAVVFTTRDSDLLDSFTQNLADSYKEMITLLNLHAVYVKENGKYYFSHTTYMSRLGEVESRSVRPMEDCTEEFIKNYGDIS